MSAEVSACDPFAAAAIRFHEAVKALTIMQVVPIFGVVAHATTGTLACECGRNACKHPGKHPRRPGWRKLATRDPAVVAEWARRWPDTNFAGLTGDVFVVDNDVKSTSGGTVDGAVTLEIFEENFGEPLPHTVMAWSGGGSNRAHRYFRAPDRIQAGCYTDLIPGVDLKGAGGYVVLPGSRHQSGRLYTWAPECGPDEVAVAPPPRWLADLILQASRRRERSASETPFDEVLRSRHGIDLAAVRLSPNATPPAWRLNALLNRRKRNHARILATWNFGRGPGSPFAFRSDFSTSAYEIALATFAACNKWPAQDIADLLICWRRCHALDISRLHRGRALCTIRKAYELAAAVGRIRQKRGRKQSALRERIETLLAGNPKLTYAEIAQRLGTSVGAVKMAIFRSRTT